MKHEYKNPWYETLGRKGLSFDPPVYRTNATPTEYKGYLIFERISKTCFDVVKDGVCVSQCAGLNGAKRRIDQFFAVEAEMEAEHGR
ncbi:MAG: hypothetical protein LUG19_03935 [Desulfovibrio sp.]|uniref:hypothetical protein n=1 Tax=Desulfovibrio sp. TaxID=885 RepID=UPI00258E7EB3|nr:hypothetical protein [Desulfovibrio sp.]MCD7983390.1 hypothetical protein [Desulfovibrio sp.]